MNKDDFAALLNTDVFDSEFLSVMDNNIIANYCEDVFSQEVIQVYKKFVELRTDAPEEAKQNIFKTIRNLAISLCQNGNLLESLVLYRFLYLKKAIILQDYPEIAVIISKLGDDDGALFFINEYSESEQNLPLKYITLANFYNFQIKDFKTAIIYYEKYLEIDKTKSVVYNILANLYQKVYGDKKLEEQIECYEKAFKLNNDDRLAMHGLAFCYEKSGQNELADKFYRLLIQNNPTDTDYYNYGHFLIHNGNFELGHKYFLKRNLIKSEPFVNSITPTQEDLDKLDKDLSDKTVLVHYEQGFGDTIMYCRFVPLLKERVKNLIFVVQDELSDLIKNSPKISDGIKIISNSEFKNNSVSYDVGVMLLDLPYVLKINSDNIPFADGYIEIEGKLIKAYGKKNINSAKVKKIGISYSGDKDADYSNRDVEFSKFNILIGLDNVELYSVQKEVDTLNEKIIPLGDTFSTFVQSACALKNMDIIISTDNIILNLAGALGVKTYGLFNKDTNFRWFDLKGNDTVWYKSVEPIQAEKQDDWDKVFSVLLEKLS